MTGQNFDNLGRELYHQPKYHFPKIYRYRLADDRSDLPRATWNRYENQFSRVTIGFAVVVGRHAYCVKWADADLSFR